MLGINWFLLILRLTLKEWTTNSCSLRPTPFSNVRKPSPCDNSKKKMCAEGLFSCDSYTLRNFWPYCTLSETSAPGGVYYYSILYRGIAKHIIILGYRIEIKINGPHCNNFRCRLQGLGDFFSLFSPKSSIWCKLNNFLKYIWLSKEEFAFRLHLDT